MSAIRTPSEIDSSEIEEYRATKRARAPAMCDCFSLAPPLGTPDRSALHATATGAQAPDLSEVRRGPWIDVHAHPGRCFLRGLPPDDLFVKLLGADAIPEALEDQASGHVALSCYATVSDLRVIEVGPGGGLRAGRPFAPGEAQADHLRQLGALRSLWELPSVHAIRTATDVGEAHAKGHAGVMITCEGADFLEGDLGRVEAAFEAGVRSVTLVHYRVNELGDIQTEAPVHGGLSDFGREVVQEMNRLGMIIDLAHATHQATKDALSISTAPMMISHSHLASGEGSHPRLLSVEHARALTQAGGLIGAWPSGVAIRDFGGYVDEILRLIDQVGVEHVAIGTDLDANYQPVLKRYGEFPALASALLGRGLEVRELRRVLGENFLDLFQSVSETARS